MKKLSLLLLIASICETVVIAQSKKTVTDYLNVPGPIAFDNKSYLLSWSSHPAPTYYKQEYITAGDKPDLFTSMIMLELATGNITVKDAAAAKLEELKNMKASNPMVNYESFQNPGSGEYMIDFLLSQNTSDGKDIAIVERNVYRYVPFKDNNGNQGIMLFAVSTRSYGNHITSFLTDLKKTKKDLVNHVAAYKIPVLTVNK